MYLEVNGMSTEEQKKSIIHDKTDISQENTADNSPEKEDDYMFYLKSKMDHFSAVPEKEK